MISCILTETEYLIDRSSRPNLKFPDEKTEEGHAVWLIGGGGGGEPEAPKKCPSSFPNSLILSAYAG